ncbi:C40 family peptidase [Bifidobacterium leontopitheci]|uniref:LGFP repeat-containing protein n=1 Tax=Bifidobacterium leontopitheci TaxID=2650774 RepID=A0A6I1GQH5_9BIFI|nr:NlpC/P60 family protein [Bifidobacterium leontopitheci]KAB7790338.1 LGFP repeat-containing protein [Bifidobacterium leontopitheci]
MLKQRMWHKAVRVVAAVAAVITAASIMTPAYAAGGVEVGSGSSVGVTGWQKVGGDSFYLDQGVPLKGDQTIQGNSYYFTEDTGVMYTGWRKLSNGKYVYYAPDGRKLYGEHKIGGSWFYLEPKTGYRHGGWAKLGNQIYKLYDERTGARLSGTHMYKGYRFWFDSKTGATDKYGWQNPPQYFQVSNRSVKFNYPSPWNYATPSRLQVNADRNQAIEQMIRRAHEYLGSRYVWDYALSPSKGVDCAGLVMQSLYATGMNLGDYNPYKHWYDPYHSHDANNMQADSRFYRAVALNQRKRGDLIFYVGHVAIYLGNNQVIEAYPPRVRIANIFDDGRIPTKVARPFL